MKNTAVRRVEERVDRPGYYDQYVKVDRVHRALYTDEAIFREEMRKVYGHTWVYLL